MLAGIVHPFYLASGRHISDCAQLHLELGRMTCLGYRFSAVPASTVFYAAFHEAVCLRSRDLPKKDSAPPWAPHSKLPTRRPLGAHDSGGVR